MTPEPQNELLSATGLDIGYSHQGETKTVASNLELSLRAGEFICLLGPNGAGKSTLIRTLSGMQTPLGGQLTLQGQALENIAPRERARRVSVVLTEALPIGMMDAYSLVSLWRHPYSGWLGGLNAHDRTRIEWAFEAVGAAPLANRQIDELSDGERQKISIARALAQEAQIMLLDEPTAFLDLPRRVELMTILRDLAHREQMGLLLSTHDLDLALRFADRLWLLTTDGQLEQGYPEALAMNGEFARVFASESLDWDAGSGSFRAHASPYLNARIEGNGLASLWTRRALERLGFGIIDTQETAALTIQLSGGAESPAWTLHHNGETARFDTIEAFIDWIRAEDWSSPRLPA